MRVLWIDDEERLSSYAQCELLEPHGFEITRCTEAAEAMRLMEEPEQKWEAILLDIMMPCGEAFSYSESVGGTETGLRLAEKIRERNKDVRIILFTARRDLEEEARALNAVYITKPASTWELVEALGESNKG